MEEKVIIELTISIEHAMKISNLIEKFKNGEIIFDGGFKPEGVKGKRLKHTTLILTDEGIPLLLPSKPLGKAIYNEYPHTQTVERMLKKDGYITIDLTDTLKNIKK